MKIRIKGNTIRFRLAKSEVEHFGKEGYLSEETEFSDKKFIYEVRAIKIGDGLSADFYDDTITLFVPQHLAAKWTTTELVGYQHEMKLRDGKKLFLLLEKDYKCLDVVSEDQSDNYENPRPVNG